MTMNTEPLIRVSISINRKEGITEEEFHRYWAKVHAPMVREWLIRSGVLKYVQYHTTSELKALAKNAGAASGKPAMSYDGTADFWVRRYEDFENAFLDTEYMEKVKADEMSFIDVASAVVTVGVDYLVVDDGRVVETHLRSF